jgi:hypothetical protein
VFPVLADADERAEKPDPAAFWVAIGGTTAPIERTIVFSEPQGKPISATFELQNGALQLSVYTKTADGFAVVLVQPNTAAICRIARRLSASSFEARHNWYWWTLIRATSLSRSQPVATSAALEARHRVTHDRTPGDGEVFLISRHSSGWRFLDRLGTNNSALNIPDQDICTQCGTSPESPEQSLLTEYVSSRPH